jgi:hypothetical protein
MELKKNSLMGIKKFSDDLKFVRTMEFNGIDNDDNDDDDSFLVSREGNMEINNETIEFEIEKMRHVKKQNCTYCGEANGYIN